MGKHKGLIQRNVDILNQIKQGDTLEQVGSRYGMSRQRVDQIIKRLGYSTKDFVDRRRYTFYISTCNICNKEFPSDICGKYFCSSKCMKIAFSRPSPKGKYRTTTRGGRSISRHRLAMEEFLGRRLKKGETVHHIDGNRDNNNIENLTIMNSHSHSSMESIAAWERMRLRVKPSKTVKKMMMTSREIEKYLTRK